MSAGLHRFILSITFFCGVAYAQNLAFEMRSYPDSPVTFPNSSWSPWRAGSDRRIFLTIQNTSAKAVSAVTFEESIKVASKREILSLERVSILTIPREKKRLSISVVEVMDRIKSISPSTENAGNPIVAIVAVEFSDGTLWNAP